jgi:hypothetical protein
LNSSFFTVCEPHDRSIQGTPVYGRERSPVEQRVLRNGCGV